MITILTPTYNRVDLLPRLYNSLLSQNNKDFKWLIVDDGSNDNTAEYISKIIKEKKINIKLIRKDNGGKHSALNIGFDNITTKWFAIVDSDDWLDFNCIERIVKEVHLIKNESCIVMHRKFPNGKINGVLFNEGSRSKLSSLYDGLKGDYFEIFKSKDISEFRFPVFYNEKFMAESPLHIYVGVNYLTKYIDYAGYIGDYLDDGLTSNSVLNRYKNINSTLYVYSMQYFNLKLSKAKIKAGVNWWRFGISNNLKLKSFSKRPSVLLFPFGFFLYFKDKFNK
ncbi:glycosyltransferase [Photobacterium carnosum]|uniref:glycosyltransferase family A protein n=1 Tax=Photobacterium carnosum TaxID=2023717 RepID=UPI001E5BC62D|nr:glycosyltransferase family 2 protein [Photobacterium carnosum]MCD9542977.1 glycosyltransferase [Photobacterium carnosum]